MGTNKKDSAETTNNSLFDSVNPKSKTKSRPAGLKTGPGGFEIDGKNHTYDSVEPGSPGLESSPIVSSDNDVNVDNSPKDLGDNIKLTLGHYLSDLTSDNDFSVDNPLRPPIDSSITTTDGVPEPLTLGIHQNDEQFSDAFKDKPDHGLNLPIQSPKELEFQDRFGPKIQDPIKELKSGFSKGRTSPQFHNGNKLLSGIDGPSDAHPVIGNYVTRVLNNNRFSSANRSITGVGDINDPERHYNPSLRHPKYGAITHHRLAQVGSTLSIRAGRELNAAEPGNNPSSGPSEAEAILPGINQLAVVKVPLRHLKASDVLETLTSDEIGEKQLKSITDGINDGSWGALNNVHDQWSGISALGMIALSIALVAAVTVVIGGLGVIINVISPGTGPVPSKVQGRYTLGKYTVTPNVNPSALGSIIQLDIVALLGIRPTTFPFGSALETGTLAFFGIEGDSFTDLLSLDALDAAVSNPGWNAIVARTIVRSSTEIITALSNIGGSGISIFKGILNIVEVLRSSKLIAAINIFANLGDQVLTSNDKKQEIVNDEYLEESVKKSRIDAFNDNVLNASVRKNRLNKSLKLAWSSNRAPSMYLLPDALYTLSTVGNQLGGFDVGLDNQESRSKTQTSVIENGAQSTGLRIPYDGNDDITVKKMEKALDAEYMPFYFHDLRTNEIISFHAFITALTDDYAPSWEKSDGFGRVDQVRIYKNTVRTVSLSFIVAATSEVDFADMWIKINKLVTLVFPQYTRGRQLSAQDGKYKFTQPFSQLIGSSPVIRLRLGDLLKNNSSRFALARLFGADSNLMTLNDDKPLNFSGGSEAIKKIGEIIAAHTTPGAHTILRPDFTWMISQNKMTREQAKSGLGLPSLDQSSGLNGANEFNVELNHLQYFTFKIKRWTDDLSSAIVEPNFITVHDLIQLHGMNPKQATELFAELQAKYQGESESDMVIGIDYIAPREMLQLSRKSKKSELEKITNVQQPALEELAKFLDPEKNALIKSFKSTQGKGLAGTIESLNFDWYENIPWEVKNGSAAPKLCRISITFSPIHDISPGIDHNGFNRAPVYPVGYHNQGYDDFKSKG